MHLLAKELDAQIIAKPLLVEACIARCNNDSSNSNKWAVLVDDKTHSIRQDQVDNESEGSPLSSRLRTSIAHELLHLLQIELNGDNPKFVLRKQSKDTNLEHLVKIEKEVESNSSLILIPEFIIDEISSLHDITLSRLNSIRKKVACSRHMLIQRLCILKRGDDRIYRQGLHNVIIGLLFRDENGSWKFDKNHLFHNFESNRLPWFINSLCKRVNLSVEQVIMDKAFFLLGGNQYELEFPGHRESEFLEYMRMSVLFSIERKPRDWPYPILFMVRKIQAQ